MIGALGTTQDLHRSDSNLLKKKLKILKESTGRVLRAGSEK